MDFSNIKVGDIFFYTPAKTKVRVIHIENKINGAPFFGQTVWFMPMGRSAGSYPFSLPKSILGSFLEAFKEPEPTHK